MRSVTIATALTAAALMMLPAQAAEVEWRLGSQLGPRDTGTLALEEFADRAHERSEGRIEIEVVPLESIGFQYDDALRIMRQGVLEAVHIYPYYMSRDEPRLMAFLPHTVLLDREQNLDIAEIQFEIAREIYEDWDLVPIAPTTLGGDVATQHVVCTRPVNTLDELRKVKLRHFEKVGLDAMNALGVSAQTLPFGELYLALRTGVLDCSFSAPSFTKSASLYEVADYFADIGYSTIASPIAITVHKDEWEALPEDLQAILIEIGEEMHAEQIAEWRSREAEMEAEAYLREQGMTQLDPFPEEDRLEIRAAMLDAWREYVEDLSPEAVEVQERVLEALGEI